jgi:hypothetical protein
MDLMNEMVVSVRSGSVTPGPMGIAGKRAAARASSAVSRTVGGGMWDVSVASAGPGCSAPSEASAAAAETASEARLRDLRGWGSHWRLGFGVALAEVLASWDLSGSDPRTVAAGSGSVLSEDRAMSGVPGAEEGVFGVETMASSSELFSRGSADERVRDWASQRRQNWAQSSAV